MIHRLLLLCVVASGCARYAKIDPKNVTTLQVISGDGPKDRRICARGDVVEVAATMKDGKTYYEGMPGVVDEKRFDPALVRLTSSVGRMNDRSWNPPDAAMAMLDTKVTITATLIANPSITSKIELEPHWKCWAPTAAAGGEIGGGGDGGQAGDAGGQGGDAGGGGAGGHAPRTTVAIGYIPYQDGKLVAVTVEPQGWPMQAYLLDPTITMKVFAGGGAGGGGGGGGPGGDAAGAGQRGGNGGRGGDGGDGGDGGEVTVVYDAASPELAKFVVVDNGAGPGGGAGEGGYGGAAENDDLVGQPGPPGRPGRDGRPGPSPRFMARAGISDLMTEAAGTRTDARPPAEPIAKAKRPGKNSPPPHAAPPPPSKPQRREDGARTYVGKATVALVVKGHPPMKQSNRMEVVSTRTRKRHFTIELQTGCVLAFHRSMTSTQHIYALDAPTICEENGSKMTIHRGTLELDTKRSTLSLTFDGKFTVAGKKPVAGTAHLEMKDAAWR